MKYEFDLKDLLPIGITLVVVTIVLAFGLQILANTKDTIGDDNCAGYWNSASNVCQVNTTNTTALSSNPAEFNATMDGIEGVAKLPEKLPLIATVILAVVIIGILVKYFRN